MCLLPGTITKDCLVKDIVMQDYRTATVFEEFGIGYCCGGNLSLEATCLVKGIAVEQVIAGLNKITRSFRVSSTLSFEDWSVDFLTDYIINIHHHYLQHTLPGFMPILNRFVGNHSGKYPYMTEVLTQFNKLHKELPCHMEEEEAIIFPYIRHLAHAYESNDSYAVLLVKTLRKPIPKIMEHDHGLITDVLSKIRQLTSSYEAPERSCTSHHVVLSRLAELDNDLTQHIFLENEVLFPKALSMEKELLHRTG